MKNVSYFLLPLLLFPLVVFASIDYSYAPIDALDPQSLILNVSFNDYTKDVNCGGLKFWGIQAVEHITGATFLGQPRFVSSSDTSQTFTMNLPPANYEEMMFVCSENGEDIAFQMGSLENDILGDQIIFSTETPLSPEPVLELTPEPAALLPVADSISQPLEAPPPESEPAPSSQTTQQPSEPAITTSEF